MWCYYLTYLELFNVEFKTPTEKINRKNTVTKDMGGKHWSIVNNTRCTLVSTKTL